MNYAGWIQSNNSLAAELVSEYFDCVVIDLEHGCLGFDGCVSLIPVIQRKAECFVRTYGHSYDAIARILDAGCDGLIVPRVNTLEIAQNVITSARYPRPACDCDGYFVRNFSSASDEFRGFGIGREQQFDTGYSSLRCRRQQLFLQIEHHEILRDIDDVMRLDHDGIFVGPYDLTQSMGIPGEFSHPDFKKAIDFVGELSQQYRKKIGIHIVDASIEKIKECEEKGFNFIAVGTDAVLLKQKLQEIKGKLK